ncbi:MAG: sortase [Peptococcaceae bacterium]|nr:sortase [Peptococcaceae bacterium]
MTRRKLGGIALMLVGVLALFAALGIAINNHQENEQATDASAKVLAEMQAAGSQGGAVGGSVIIDGNEYIGALYFPSLNLQVPIMANISDAALMVAPCRQAGSVAEGGLVIAGHNFVNQFGRLDRLCVNDPIFFTDVQGNVTPYSVSEIELIAENNAAAMLQSSWDMSLYTCDYSGNQRLTLRCERMTSE